MTINLIIVSITILNLIMVGIINALPIKIEPALLLFTLMIILIAIFTSYTSKRKDDIPVMIKKSWLFLNVTLTLMLGYSLLMVLIKNQRFN